MNEDGNDFINVATDQPGVFSEIPIEVCFEPLYLCNMRCNYCYIGEEHNVAVPTIPKFEITANILATLRNEGVRQIYLAGGEPAAHPNFDQLCKYIAELGFDERGIITNGTLISKNIAQLLKDLGFWVNVSVRGPDSKISDDIARSNGTFHRTLEGLHNLCQAGISPAIEFDPIQANYKLLYSTIQILVEYGISIREVWLHRIAPFGDASNLETPLSVEQYQEVFEQARSIKEDFGIQATFEDSFPLCLLDDELRTHTAPCDCGNTLANIDPYGNLRRCACHPGSLGNILQSPLRDLWREGLSHFRSLVWLSSDCQQCDLLRQCGGGCSVSSKSTQGYAPDRFAERFSPVKITQPSNIN